MEFFKTPPKTKKKKEPKPSAAIQANGGVDQIKAHEIAKKAKE